LRRRRNIPKSVTWLVLNHSGHAIRVDRILQSLPYALNVPTKRVEQMAKQLNIRGNFVVSGAEAAGPGLFGTTGLSGVSDFATHKPQWGVTAFCKPSFKADEYGVRRASDATRGCEFGRSE
jgi:hypothetical protein